MLDPLKKLFGSPPKNIFWTSKKKLKQPPTPKKNVPPQKKIFTLKKKLEPHKKKNCWTPFNFFWTLKNQNKLDPPLSFMVMVILSTLIKRFSVSRMRDFQSLGPCTVRYSRYLFSTVLVSRYLYSKILVSSYLYSTVLFSRCNIVIFSRYLYSTVPGGCL